MWDPKLASEILKAGDRGYITANEVRDLLRRDCQWPLGDNEKAKEDLEIPVAVPVTDPRLNGGEHQHGY